MRPTSPCLSQELITIHRVITHAMNTATIRGVEYLHSGFHSRDERLGFARFIQCLLSVYCSHHQAEDLIAFPTFRKMLPLAPYVQFAAEHRQMEDFLSLVPELLHDISSETPEFGLRILVTM